MARKVFVDQSLFGIMTFERFQWAYDMIASRCFGYYVPSPIMILPLADMLNHERNSNVTYYTVHETLEKLKPDGCLYKQKRPAIYH